MTTRKFTRRVFDWLSGLGMSTTNERTELEPAAVTQETPSEKNNGAVSSYISGSTVSNDLPMSPFWGASNPAFHTTGPSCTPSHPPAS